MKIVLASEHNYKKVCPFGRRSTSNVRTGESVVVMSEKAGPLAVNSPSDEDLQPFIRSAYSAKKGSFESLFQLIYRDLKNIAKHRLAGERQNHTLQATALVHEAFLRLAKGNTLDIKDKNHLLALSSRIMRNVLVDYARRRNASRRQHERSDLPVEENIEPMTMLDPDHQIDVLDLDKALSRMEKDLSRLVRVVECKFFAAMTTAEIAETLEVSERTVERDWDRARAHLLIAMQEGNDNG